MVNRRGTQNFNENESSSQDEKKFKNPFLTRELKKPLCNGKQKTF